MSKNPNALSVDKVTMITRSILSQNLQGLDPDSTTRKSRSPASMTDPEFELYTTSTPRRNAHGFNDYTVTFAVRRGYTWPTGLEDVFEKIREYQNPNTPIIKSETPITQVTLIHRFTFTDSDVLVYINQLNQAAKEVLDKSRKMTTILPSQIKPPSGLSIQPQTTNKIGTINLSNGFNQSSRRFDDTLHIRDYSSHRIEGQDYSFALACDESCRPFQRVLLVANGNDAFRVGRHNVEGQTLDLNMMQQDTAIKKAKLDYTVRFDSVIRVASRP